MNCHHLKVLSCLHFLIIWGIILSCKSYHFLTYLLSKFTLYREVPGVSSACHPPKSKNLLCESRVNPQPTVSYLAATLCQAHPAYPCSWRLPLAVGDTHVPSLQSADMNLGCFLFRRGLLREDNVVISRVLLRPQPLRPTVAS